MRLVFVGIKSAAWKYFADSDLVVWDRILFTLGFDCCGSSRTSHITVCLFLVTPYTCCPLFWTVILYWSSVMVHPAIHCTPKYISWVVLTVGTLWIRLASLVSPDSGSVATCDNSMVMPSGSLAVMFFYIVTAIIFGVSLFDKWILSPEYVIDNV